MSLDLIQQQSIHWQVTFLSNFLENGPIGQIVQIVVILAHIEETAPFQPKWLMYLKIKADGLHHVYVVILFVAFVSVEAGNTV